MKKYLFLMLALSLVFAGCGKADSPGGLQPTQAPVQLANPYGTYETAQEMEQAAGLEVSLPEQLPDWVQETIYRAIPGELIEVIYTTREDPNDIQEIRVRVKEGNEDITGVYGSDAQEAKTVQVGENTVELQGVTLETTGEFLVFVSKWTSEEGRTYSVTSTQGVLQQELIPLLEQIR